MTEKPGDLWHVFSLDRAKREMDCDLSGLKFEEAADRRLRFGPNVIKEERHRSVFIEFLLRFRNPLVLLLIAASVLSAVTGDSTSAGITATMVLLSVTLDFIQEYRAGRAAKYLSRNVVIRTQALRDGLGVEIATTDIVPGDIVMVSAGSLIPADGLVFEAKDFFVNQALLTGEPYPVEKHSTPVDAEETGSSSNPADSPRAVFMGSAVISGSSKILVCRTGANTMIGGIAHSVAQQPPATAFEKGARRFGLLIMRFSLLLVLFVLLVNTLFHRPWFESIFFAVALAVGLTPELLPMVISVTLSRGAIRMASRRVIVKRLSAIQDLGSMEILCTDKTGTLTEGRIILERHLDALGRESERVLFLAYLNSFFETGLKSPLDEAILQHRTIDVSSFTKVDEVPFDFERRRVSVLTEEAGKKVLIVKGAPEDILEHCVSYEAAEGDIRPLDEETRKKVSALFDDLGRSGLRALGIAWKNESADCVHAVISDETELIFAGFAAFLDPPRASAERAVKDLSDSGIALKIITGDNEPVTRHLCETLKIPVLGAANGSRLAELDDPGLEALAESVNIFCRVTPAQKKRVIAALRARGRIVGYMGDGINDAPSLRASDVGISVYGAVDVAKEAADLIMLDQGLEALHEGVLEGRRTAANILKYILMGTSSNFGNMFSMAGASLFLPFLPMKPVQILLNNFLYDLSEVAIPFDRVDEGVLSSPQKWDISLIRSFMLAMGPVSTIFDFLTFYTLYVTFQADEKTFQTGWFIESISTQVLVIFLIRSRGSFLSSRPHPLLAALSISVVGIAWAVALSAMGHFFGFTSVSPTALGAVVILTGMYLVVAEIVKRLFFRLYRKKLNG